MLVAKAPDGGSIGVAYASSLLSLEHGGVSGWLEELYVLPQWRGLGIGSRLIAEVVTVLLPISLPIFAVVFILSFIVFMSEYPVASVLLQARNNWTLAVGANSFLPEHEQLWAGSLPWRS
jgi:maltose/maltodextrin transport system permease protein